MLFLFHHDDLAHREHSPPGWYNEDFAHRRESSAGRLVAWGTGGDGGYEVRVTTGDLTESEKKKAGGYFEFPFVVRHGRVFIDNGDALPGHGEPEKTQERANQWVNMPNGNYRVTVQGVGRSSENPKLPDYVLLFEDVETIDAFETVNYPPTIEVGDWGLGHHEAPGSTVDLADAQRVEARQKPYQWTSMPIAAGEFPAIAIGPDESILPGGSASRPVSEEVAEYFFPENSGVDHEPPGPVLATVLEPGQLAIASEINGRSWGKGVGSRIKGRATAVVRIVEVGDGPLLPIVRVEAVDKPDMNADDASVAAFRSKLLAAVKPREEAGDTGGPTAPAFELEKLEMLVSAEAVTGWALRNLPMPFDERLRLWISPAKERIAGIERLLSR